MGWSEGWKERVIVPIVKKGEGKTVEEYRGDITLMAVLYKVYVMELTEEENALPLVYGARKTTMAGRYTG